MSSPQYKIPDNDNNLLADCRVWTYRSSGPGGQNVNRRETAIRLFHKPSGLTVTCQLERSQLRNKQIALERLRSKLELRQKKKKKRVPTKIPKAIKKRILQNKRHQSEKKKLRQKPVSDSSW